MPGGRVRRSWAQHGPGQGQWICIDLIALQQKIRVKHWELVNELYPPTQSPVTEHEAEGAQADETQAEREADGTLEAAPDAEAPMDQDL